MMLPRLAAGAENGVSRASSTRTYPFWARLPGKVLPVRFKLKPAIESLR